MAARFKCICSALAYDLCFARMFLYLVPILLSFTTVSYCFESYKLRVGSTRVDGKLDSKLIMNGDSLIVLCDLVDLNHDNMQRSQILYQEFTSLGHTPSLTISNDTWRQTFRFVKNDVEKEWVVDIWRHQINSSPYSVGQWSVLVELVRDTGIFHTTTSLFDISREPLLQWSLGQSLDDDFWNGLSRNVSSVLTMQSMCSPDVVVAFVQSASKFPVALVGVSYNSFQANYTTWYDLLPTLCQLNELECTGVKFMDVFFTGNHLLVLTTNGLYVSDRLNSHNVTGQILEFTAIEISGVDDSMDLQHSKVWHSGQCRTESVHQSLHQNDYTSLVVPYKTDQDRQRVYLSTAPYRVWFDVTRRIEGRVIAVLYVDEIDKFIVLKTQQTDNIARVAVYNADQSLYSSNQTTETFAASNKPFPEFAFPGDFRPSGLFLHPRSYVLYAFGTQVWVSVDSGNSFTKLLVLSDGEHIVRCSANQFHDMVVFTTNMANIYYGSAGVSRLVLISLAESGTIPGVYVDFKGYLHRVGWSEEQMQLQTTKVDIQAAIQEYQATHSKMLAIQPFTAKEVYLFEYSEGSEDTPVFNKDSVWKTVNFSCGSKILIVGVEDYPSSTVFRTFVKGYVISPVHCQSSDLADQSVVITALGKTMVQLHINSTGGGWSLSDIGKTVSFPRHPSILLTEFLNTTHVLGQSVTPVISQSRSLQPGGWCLYDLRNWTLGEDECQHVLIPDDVVSKYPVQYVDVGENFTFSVTAVRKDGVLPDAKPLLSVTASSPHLVTTHSETTVDRHGYETLTVTIKHDVFALGTAKVTVHLWQASLRCPQTSFTVTILCACPPRKHLRYEYPYVISLEDYMRGNPRDDTFRRRPLLFDLEVNYRPPSKYGVSIPTSSNIYNADPSKQVPKSMFQISKESWSYKQCAGKQSREECNCTDWMRYSNLVKYSDCKQRVYKVRQASGKIPLKFYLHRDETQILMTSPYVITLEEVNDRKDYFIQNMSSPSLNEMIADERLVNRSQYLDPNRARIVMQGSGLYHFRAEVIPGFSYCQLEDEFQVFIDGAVLPYPLQMIVIVFTSIVIGGILFSIYLWYLHNHHTHRTIRIGSRCQKIY